MDKTNIRNLSRLAITCFAAALTFLSAPQSFAVCPPSGDDSEQEISSFLAELDHAQGRLGGPRSVCTTLTSDQLVPRDPAVRFASAGMWPQGVCVPEPSLDRVCQAASSYCNTPPRGPYTNCLGGLGDPTRCIPDRELVVSHQRNIDYAARRFYSLVQNPALQQHCCGSHEGCRSQWRSTRLNLLMGLGADDQTGLFRHRNGNVYVAVGFLANCTTSECIDRFIFHELGHVCDFAVKRNPQEALVRFTTPNVALCVMEGLRRNYRLSSTPVDFDVWIKEALADAIFISQWSGSPGGWGWACVGAQNAEHCSQNAYMGCFLDLPSVRRQVCGR